MHILHLSLRVLIVLIISSSTVIAAELEFARCLATQGPQIIDAECATFSRSENPNNPDGRKLALSVVKLPSRSQQPAKDAFTLIQGGPGGSSIDLGIAYSSLLEEIRKHRDIILVDQRGTGRSNLLACEMLEDETLGIGFDPVAAKQSSLKCANELDADLRFYTTSVAVQDLDALRSAAGYQQLTIYGVSYGTRVAQHYLRRFPENTRAVILDGVVPIGLNLAGGEIARRSQAAFEHMADQCASAIDCNKNFGDLKRKFGELRTRLAMKAIDIKIPDPISGVLTDKKVSEGDLLGVIRLLAYSTESNALLPMIISSAHAGNYIPLVAQSMMISSDFLETYATGMNNSVICAEDAPFVNDTDLQGLGDTYFSREMAETISAICEVWPRGLVDKDFFEAIETDRPVLILSGETDPITPPQNGEQAHQMFTDSKHIIVPAHGHGVLTRGCIPYLVTDFIENVTISDLDANCTQRERAMPFFNDATGPKS